MKTTRDIKDMTTDELLELMLEHRGALCGHVSRYWVIWGDGYEAEPKTTIRAALEAFAARVLPRPEPTYGERRAKELGPGMFVAAPELDRAFAAGRESLAREMEKPLRLLYDVPVRTEVREFVTEIRSIVRSCLHAEAASKP